MLEAKTVVISEDHGVFPRSRKTRLENLRNGIKIHYGHRIQHKVNQRGLSYNL